MSLEAHQRYPAKFTDLPNELLSTVLQHLPPLTLAILARVSSEIQGAAERLLYSSVCLTDTLSESSPAPHKVLRWCESMQQRLHLVQSVKKLHIRWQAHPGRPPSPYLHAVCSQMADVLRLLIYLESLELYLGPANFASPDTQPDDEHIHAVERVIYDCRLPLLHHCSLGADWTKGAQPYTHILTSFLVSLPALRHLRLADHHAGLGLPAEALPHLASFRGSANTAAALLPGRPVQALSLIGQDSDVNSENLPCMTHTTLPLRFLDLSAMSVRPVLLRHISTHLSSVEALRVRLALRHTLHYAFSGIVSHSLCFSLVTYTKNVIVQVIEVTSGTLGGPERVSPASFSGHVAYRC